MYRIFLILFSFICSSVINPYSERYESCRGGKSLGLDHDLLPQILDPPPSTAVPRKMLWRSLLYESCSSSSRSGTTCSRGMPCRPTLLLQIKISAQSSLLRLSESEHVLRLCRQAAEPRFPKKKKIDSACQITAVMGRKAFKRL